MNSDFGGKWQGIAEEAMRGVKGWRLAHPRATMQEIEEELDKQLARLRVQMLTDTAMASASTAMRSGVEAERAVCPECGKALEARGKQERLLTSQHNQVVKLERSYGVCPQCEAGFFPSG
jgi:predicted RNA-binding Zn-ribbon protein involved in translation (DUF1610 family)